MPYETCFAFKWEWAIKVDFDFIFVDRPSVFRVNHLVEIFLISAFAVPFTPLDRQSTVVPLPVVLDDKVYHFLITVIK